MLRNIGRARTLIVQTTSFLLGRGSRLRSRDTDRFSASQERMPAATTVDQVLWPLSAEI